MKTPPLTKETGIIDIIVHFCGCRVQLDPTPTGVYAAALRNGATIAFAEG